jgi:hypothetical protein
MQRTANFWTLLNKSMRKHHTHRHGGGGNGVLLLTHCCDPLSFYRSAQNYLPALAGLMAIFSFEYTWKCQPLSSKIFTPSGPSSSE